MGSFFHKKKVYEADNPAISCVVIHFENWYCLFDYVFKNEWADTGGVVAENQFNKSDYFVSENQ